MSEMWRLQSSKRYIMLTFTFQTIGQFIQIQETCCKDDLYITFTELNRNGPNSDTYKLSKVYYHAGFGKVEGIRLDYN